MYWAMLHTCALFCAQIARLFAHIKAAVALADDVDIVTPEAGPAHCDSQLNSKSRAKNTRHRQNIALSPIDIILLDLAPTALQTLNTDIRQPC